MNDTVKLIIEIPKAEYERLVYIDHLKLRGYIENGTPLDDVKAEIAEEICLTDNPYTKETKYTIEYSKMLELLDNIGKVEKGGE